MSKIFSEVEPVGLITCRRCIWHNTVIVSCRWIFAQFVFRHGVTKRSMMRKWMKSKKNKRSDENKTTQSKTNACASSCG